MNKAKYYLINKRGEVETTLKIKSADKRDSCFIDGMAPVAGDAGWGYINRMGDFIIDPKFERAGQFSCGLASVAYGGKAFANPEGYIDKKGDFVIAPKFSLAMPFKEDMALVECENRGIKKFGYIDKRGCFVINPIYEELFSFSEDLAAVMIGNKFGYINKKGQVIIEPKFDRAGFFSDGLANVKVGEKYGYIGKNGSFLIPPKFDSAECFCGGIASVGIGDKYGYIDSQGRFIIDLKFGRARDFQDNIARVESNGKYGCIDNKGNFIIEPSFELIFEFHDGMAIFKEKGKYGFIDKSGVIIPPEYDYCCNFSEGVAIVVSEGSVNVLRAQKSSTSKTSSKGQQCSTSCKDPQKGSTNTSLKGRARLSNSGCYIATAVYGSYDCPEVWTLRRYRDDVLGNTWFGRLFIRTYYAISPTFVKWFGETIWFRNLFHRLLNNWVKQLNERGFKNTPYQEKY